MIVALVGVLALLVPATSGAKIPPKKGVCIERTAGKVHIQVGYCP